MDLLTKLSLHWPKVLIVLVILTGLGIGTATISFFRPRLVEFANLKQFVHFAGGHGFHLHSGAGNNPQKFALNCYVADHPLTIEQLSALTVNNCGKTAAWKGIAWVGEIDSEFGCLQLESLGGHRRIWGNVAVAGDPDLLDRLEQLFRQQGGRP